MIILDTNVISNLMSPVRDPTVIAWLDAQESGVVWTTAISVFEIRYGLARLPLGQKQTELCT